MDPITVTLLVSVAVALGAPVIIAARGSLRARGPAYVSVAAEELGLRFDDGYMLPVNPEFSGRRDGIQLVIAPGGQISAQFEAASLPELYFPAGAEGGVETGRYTLCREVHGNTTLSGRAAHGLALASPRGCSALESMLELGGTATVCSITFRRRAGDLPDADTLKAWVLACEAVVHDLRALASHPRPHLLATIRGGNPSTRDLAFEVLLTSYGDSPEAREAATLALASRDPSTLVRAATFLRDVPTVARILATHAAVNHCTAALRVLEGVPSADYDAAAAVAMEALRSPEVPIRIAAWRVLAKLRHGASLGQAIARLESWKAPEAAAAAACLAALGPAAPEAMVGEALEGGSAEVVDQLVEQLSKWGTVASVQPLMAWAEASILTPATTRTKAAAAIRAIQSRAGPVGAGRLSIANDLTAGRLSTHQGESGGLSAPDGE